MKLPEVVCCVLAFLLSWAAAFLGWALALLWSSSVLLGQGEQANNQLVIHLYVDPVYGNDGAVNQEYNPDGLGPECSGATIVGPHSVVDSTGASLLHAPYPFKTVTAAIARINQLSPAPGVPPLPHTDAATQKVWSHCIVHMLPGWYGRTGGRNDSLDSRTGTHKVNRLTPNGETFPIRIPPRVSLVGASALNTVFDLGQVGTAIEFGVYDGNMVAISGAGTVIDKITFFACGGRIDQQGNPPVNEGDPKKCAAILVDDLVAANPTISNCMFEKNVIGILVNGRGDVWHGEPSPFEVRHDGLTISSCTFAWNMIGVWNGQMSSQVSVGISKLNVINCVFDGSETDHTVGGVPCHFQTAAAVNLAWPLWGGFGSGLQSSGIHSAFEGMSEADLRVEVSAGVYLDSNAYEAAPRVLSSIIERNYNTGLIIGSGPNIIARQLPPTFPRTAGAFYPDPSRNIALYTGWPNQQHATSPTVRGILFVADLLCRGSMAGAFPSAGTPSAGGFDLSMHDLRLSPLAAAAGLAVQMAPPPLPNPLVDNGFSGSYPIVMESGNVIQGPPGSLAGSSGAPSGWALHCFDSDAEGFGNPRVHDHPAFGSLPNSGPMDVGADELGELVIAGYRFGTTSFLSLGANHPDNVDAGGNPLPPISNQSLFYLGVPSASAFGLPPRIVKQPDYRALDGFIHVGGAEVYPLSYLPISTSVPTTGKSWHSSEFPDNAGANPTGSEKRAAYSHRHQLSGRAAPSPTLPSPVSHTNMLVADFLQAFSETGKGYRATPADVTPVLLPDIHPWWTDLPPLVLASLQAYGMSPSFSNWQDAGNCPSGNYFYNYVYLVVGGVTLHFGVHNERLYEQPIAMDINAPGAGFGGTLAVQVGGVGTFPYAESYSWLDLRASPDGAATAAVEFETWSASPLEIRDFDAFGRGGFGVPATAGVRWVPLPTTRVTPPLGNQSPSELAQLGFTLEWSDLNTPWLLPAGAVRQANAQSFTVMVDSNGN